MVSISLTEADPWVMTHRFLWSSVAKVLPKIRTELMMVLQPEAEKIYMYMTSQIASQLHRVNKAFHKTIYYTKAYWFKWVLCNTTYNSKRNV